jgi:hypothetical protein
MRKIGDRQSFLRNVRSLIQIHASGLLGREVMPRMHVRRMSRLNELSDAKPIVI